MRIQQKPILHGRDHMPGHPDPIPGFLTGGTPGDFETTVLATTDLYAYWRLGETGTPWADTSGVGTPDDLALTGSGTALTPDVTGGLASGDDGAVEFNYDGDSSSGGRYLETAGINKDFGAISDDFTVAAWVKLKASSRTDRYGVVIGTFQVLGDNSSDGWGLIVAYTPTGDVLRFVHGGGGSPTDPTRYAQTSGGVTAAEWNLFVGTYDGTTIKLYANGILIDSTVNAGLADAGSDAIRVGFSTTAFAGPSFFFRSWLYGMVDEAAVWTRALTAAEIVTLYSSGVGTPGPTDGDQVLVSDGAGGSHWGQANGNAIAPQSITNNHVADDADIAPTKLEHPGGTSSFLRADGTWATPSGAGGVATDTIFDAKGDLAAGTAADTAARLAVGTNGYVLTADSSETTGIKWAAASAGSPAADTSVWMPLTSTVGSDDVLVFDANHQLIPTLTAI